LDTKSLEEKDRVSKWYEGVGNYAQLYGVTVSVITIKGAEAALEELAKVSEITGGDVARVDPMELTQNFSAIMANPIIATHVHTCPPSSAAFLY
jgi:hypothetical protein